MHVYLAFLVSPRAAGSRTRPRAAQVTWNLLSSSFSRSGAPLREWPARRAQILEELSRVDADVVCLQEVSGWSARACRRWTKVGLSKFGSQMFSAFQPVVGVFW